MSPAKKTAKTKAAKKKVAAARRVSTPKSPAKPAAKAAAKPATRPAAKAAARPAKTVARTVAKPAPKAVVPVSTRDSNDTVRMVRELAAIVERRSLTELIIDSDALTLTLRRGESAPVVGPTFLTAAPAQMAAPMMESAAPAAAPAAPAAAVPAPVALVEDDKYHVVTSPFVGTFYRRPNPDADTYADTGDRVEKGKVLCIVEAMKLMNEIEADAAGTIVEVLVKDAEPVEYGQPLFKIDPA